MKGHTHSVAMLTEHCFSSLHVTTIGPLRAPEFTNSGISPGLDMPGIMGTTQFPYLFINCSL
jgi:hypothetical protein